MLEPMQPHEFQLDLEANSYREATLDSHSRSSPHWKNRLRSPPPRKNPHITPKRNDNPQIEDTVRSPQKGRHHETVVSTPTRGRQDNQTTSIR